MPSIQKEVELHHGNVPLTCAGKYTYDGADSCFELTHVYANGESRTDISDLIEGLPLWTTLQERCRERLDGLNTAQREPFPGERRGA